MQRWVVVVFAIAGCGRLGFDAAPSSSDAARDVDAHVDTGAAFDAVALPDFSLTNAGANVLDIAAEPVPGGFDVAFVMQPQSSVWGVHLDANLVPATPQPVQTSPVDDAIGVYTSVTMRFDGTNLLGAAGASDTNTWFKTFTLDMNDFIVAENQPDTKLRPIVTTVNTPSGAQGVTWYVDTSDHLWAQTLTSTGARLGTTDWGLFPAAVRTAGASGDLSIVVVEDANGCEIGSYNVSLGYNAAAVSSPCSRPNIVTESSSTFWLAYETSGNIAVRRVTSAGSVPTVEAEQIIGAGTEPHILLAGAPSVLYRDPSGWRVTALGSLQELGVDNLPAANADAVTTAGPYAFATFGGSVYVVRPR